MYVHIGEIKRAAESGRDLEVLGRQGDTTFSMGINDHNAVAAQLQVVSVDFDGARFVRVHDCLEAGERTGGDKNLADLFENKKQNHGMFLICDRNDLNLKCKQFHEILKRSN